MKLLCINNKDIITNRFTYVAINLVEGEIYETRGKSFRDEYGQLCYYVDGVGIRLCCRFTELLEDKSELAMKKLKEEFELN